MSIILAFLCDLLFGEPPDRIHPVVWIGNYLGPVGRRLTGLAPAPAFLLGVLFWCLGAAVFVGVYVLLSRGIATLPWILGCVLTALLLKPLFALRILASEVAGVEGALAKGLDKGRSQLARIVSRDTTRLTESEVRESALESLSENLSDSFVAPLFWFALLGLPGAALYRFANTADAMWGYRGKWEWAGKWAAFFDDVMNFIPARITALLLLLIMPRCLRKLTRLRAEATKTPSPNSGWPMAALALAHGIRLGKPGVYILNPGGEAPDPAKTQACLHHACAAAGLAMVFLALGSELLGRCFHA